MTLETEIRVLKFSALGCVTGVLFFLIYWCAQVEIAKNHQAHEVNVNIKLAPKDVKPTP